MAEQSKRTTDRKVESNSGSKSSKPLNTAEKIIKAVDTGAKTVSNVAKSAGSVISAIRIIKGLFNDPKWYSYGGKLPEIGANNLRPFDTLSLKEFSNLLYPKAPGIGTGHIIVNNITSGNLRNTEAFNLATSEAFRNLRLSLRSNLPYTLEEFRDYLQSAFNLCAIAKTIERGLGWYTATRQDIPELHRALICAPGNIYELGKVNAVNVEWLQDSKVADVMSTYDMIRNALKQILLPKQLVEYISWFVGSVFVDQSQPNFQIYINILREIDMYAFDPAGEMYQMPSFDYTTFNTSYLLDVVNSIRDHRGVILADLSRIDGYVGIDLVDYRSYQMTCLDDKEMFNFIINSYTMSNDQFAYADLFYKEFTRYDVFGETLSGGKNIGGIAGLATVAGGETPFKIVSQAVYITNAKGFESGRNLQFRVDPSVDNSIAIYDNTYADNFYLQHTGLNTLDHIISNVDSTSTSALYFSEDIRVPTSINVVNLQDVAGVLGAGTYILIRDRWERDNNDPNYINHGIMPLAYTDGSINPNVNGYLTLYANVQTNTVSLYVNCPDLDTVHGGTLVSPITITGITLQNTLMNLRLIVDAVSTFSSNNPNVVRNLAVYYMQNSTVYGNIPLSGTFTISNSNNVIDVQMYNMNLDSEFVELVDYHIPIITRHRVIYKDTNFGTTQTFTALPNLLKETYVPMMINVREVKTTLYQMMMGLFAGALVSGSKDRKDK